MKALRGMPTSRDHSQLALVPKIIWQHLGISSIYISAV